MRRQTNTLYNKYLEIDQKLLKEIKEICPTMTEQFLSTQWEKLQKWRKIEKIPKPKITWLRNMLQKEKENENEKKTEKKTKKKNKKKHTQLKNQFIYIINQTQRTTNTLTIINHKENHIIEKKTYKNTN